MRLNTIKAGDGAKKARKRVGRGIGSGLGKTCGRGHKGQHSRSGGYHKMGFEGGQMPLQRRLPKFGFSSRSGRLKAEIRLSELANLETDTIDIQALKDARLIRHNITQVKVFASGNLEKAVIVKGLLVTAGARKAIETSGGKIEE